MVEIAIVSICNLIYNNGATICFTLWTHLLCIESIRWSIVACGLLVHSSSMCCEKWLEIAKNWNTLSHRGLSVHSACSYHNTNSWLTSAHPHAMHTAVGHLPCLVKIRNHPRSEHLSKVPDAIKPEHFPSLVAYNVKLRPMRTTSLQMSFPETVPEGLCRNSSVVQTECCSSCPGGSSQQL